MRRLDRAMIFLLIVGSYTAFGLLVLHGTLGVRVLITVCSAALAGYHLAKLAGQLGLDDGLNRAGSRRPSADRSP